MRSTLSRVRWARSKEREGEIGSLSSTPSIRINVCSEFAPRRKTEATPPGGPFWMTDTPKTSWRASMTVAFFDCSNLSLVITVTELATSLAGVSRRVAVTTISCWIVEVETFSSSDFSLEKALKGKIVKARAKKRIFLIIFYSSKAFCPRS